LWRVRTELISEIGSSDEPSRSETKRLFPVGESAIRIGLLIKIRSPCLVTSSHGLNGFACFNARMSSMLTMELYAPAARRATRAPMVPGYSLPAIALRVGRALFSQTANPARQRM